MAGYNLLNAYGPEGQALFLEVPWEHEENELRILAATDVEDKFKLRLLGTDSYTRVGNLITVPYPFDEAGLPWRLFIWRVTDVNETVTFDGSRIPVEAIVAKLNELSEKVEEAQLLYRRAVKAPEDMDGRMILPTETVRAGKVLGFDESGLPLSGLEYIPETKEFLDKIRKLTEDSLAELDKIEKATQEELEKFVSEDLRALAEEVCDDVMKENLDASEAAKTAAEAAAASTKTYNQGAWEAYSKTLDTLESIKDLRARCETIYAEVSKYRYEVLTRDEYNAKVEAGTTEDDVLYFVKGSVDIGALVEKWNDAGMSDVPEKLDAEITRSTEADEYLVANIAKVGKEVEKVKSKLMSAMHYKGSLATKDLLPSEAHEPGDVWNVLEDGKNYAWDGTAWDDISGVMSVPQATTTENGVVKLAASSADTGVASVLNASQVKVLLAAKADSSHTHTIANITNLQTTLDAKASASDLTALGERVASNTTAISTETSGRIAGDTTLSNALQAEASERKSTLNGHAGTKATQTVFGHVRLANGIADAGDHAVPRAQTVYNALNTESSAREAADSALDKRTTTLESSVEGLGEALEQTTAAYFALSTSLTTETSERKTADTNLQTQITTNATNITNALSKTVTTQQSVAGEVKFNGGIRADSIKTLWGTELFTTVSAKGFAFTGVYTITPYGSKTPFFESTVSGGTNTLVRATTIYEGGTALASKYAAKTHAHTISDVTNLQTTLDAKANKSDIPEVVDISGKLDKDVDLDEDVSYKTLWSCRNNTFYGEIGINGFGEFAFGGWVTDAEQRSGISCDKDGHTYFHDSYSHYALTDIISDISTAKTGVADNAAKITTLNTTVASKANNSDVIKLQNSLGGFSIKAMCQEAYDELAEKDQLTMYYIIEESILNFKLRSDGESYEVWPTGGYGTALNDCVFGDVVVPSTYKGKPVTSLYYYAFGNTTRLKSVVIPDSVTNLTASSFQNSSVVSVTIPPSITVLPDSLFYKCANLASITIPASVTEVQGCAFYLCTSLAYCKFEGNAPTVVDKDQFGECPALTEIHVNSGTTGWGDTWCGKTVVVDNA